MTGARFISIEKRLRSFFPENQCHPRKIVPDKIREFLSTMYRDERYLFDDILQALKAFYTCVPTRYPEETGPQLHAVNNFSAATTDELIGRLLNDLKLKEHSPSTRKTYCREVKKYLNYLDRMPTPDDRPDIESYLLTLRNEKKLSARTINLALSAIATFYRKVMAFETTTKDVPRMKPGKDLPKVYGQGDIGKIIDCIQNIKHRLVIMLVYGGGLRLNEIRVLKLTDIDWDRKVIRINGKGSRQRDIPLDECFISPLKSYLSATPGLTYLFEGRKKGKPYPKRTIRKIYDNVCKRSGIHRKGGIHSLRHSYATHLLEQGVDINKIKTLSGHSSVKTTQIHTHVSREEIAKIRSPLATIKSIHIEDPKGN